MTFATETASETHSSHIWSQAAQMLKMTTLGTILAISGTRRRSLRVLLVIVARSGKQPLRVLGSSAFI